MAKVTQVNNNDTGLQARTAYNEAMKTVEVDGVTITGSGVVGDPLVAAVSGSPIRSITQTAIPVADASTTDIVIGDDVKTYSVASGATTLAFTVSSGSDTEEHTAKRTIDNSGNSSAVTISWSNANLDWSWLSGDPITSLAAGAKLNVEIQVESSTEVLGITDTKA